MCLFMRASVCVKVYECVCLCVCVCVRAFLCVHLGLFVIVFVCASVFS